MSIYAMELASFYAFWLRQHGQIFQILGCVFLTHHSPKKDSNKNGMLGMRNLVFVCRSGNEGFPST